MENRSTGLKPVFDTESKILILGSMPSAQSLLKQQYYGHAQNHFWPLIFTVFDGGPVSEDYAVRTAFLLSKKIALWDVIHTCVREGSLDQHIRMETPNGIPEFVSRHAIQKIAFNGRAAEQYYFKYFRMPDGVEWVRLPSSSPVPRRDIRTLYDKLPAYQILRDWSESV